MSKEVTIIQQNDTHGSIELHHELFWEGNGPQIHKAGGFSRIANYIKEVKKQKQNVLFFDGGDLFHGTAPLVSSRGEAILTALRMLPLDGFVPGNWEFAYGKEQLLSLTEQLSFPTLACNVKHEGSNEFVFSPYIIQELSGMKVGVIGLTYPYVDQTMPAGFADGLAFSKGIEEVEQIVEKLRNEKVDLIVLLSHMGLPLDVKLASMINGIHIILSGHSHDRVKKPIIQGETLIVQSGASSSFIGRLDVTVDNGKIIDYKHELIPLFEHDYKEDEEMKEMIEAILRPYAPQMEEIVGRTDKILHRMTLNEAPMDRLITDAYLHSFDADLAFSHGWRYGTPIPAGPVTLYDIHSIIPTNPEVFTMDVSGEILLKALEKNLEQVFSSDPFEQKGGYILRSSGLFMAFKPYNPKGSRIQELLINGQGLDTRKTYKIAGAGEQLFKGITSPRNYKGKQAVEAISGFLKDKKRFESNHSPSIISV
ncbi:bifunctional metallophosphatase/5'-nucleotidase [Bacillus aerolatus]|uniref:Bifunctional metallophosphatase/5'-nucleotidase n=1 Tax=Bacillus aerolatus TaxID=2653354 RepID=A0A6I1FHV8_9BACI|nr:bifunctional UDP-sugar hydrolase/5'-nucleotidase [Bacillus aerolatus]KAB7705254.1 bifunctional metallophosphatase/5'-nucleotidase [Bacillus aerolatus]